MSTAIYYFSGTGNSLAVARDVAAGLEARLVPIPSMMDRERMVIDADATGLVFPVYHKGLPLILQRFVEKLDGLEDTLLFAVCTYGDTPGVAMEHLDHLVQSHGGRLAAQFGVHMPYNYLTPSPVLRGFFRSFTLREVAIEKQQALLEAAPATVQKIVASVRAREPATLETKPDVLTRMADALDLPELFAKPVWLKVAGVEGRTDMSFLESRQLMDHAFWADEGCNGCRICARVCPVGNIEMLDDDQRSHQVPVWQHRCEQCFACLQWCPQEAIQFGANTTGRRRYHHPDVRPADMVRAASRAGTEGT